MGSIIAVPCVLVAGYAFMRSQPACSPEELASVRAEVDTYRELVQGLSCERPQLFPSEEVAAGPSLREAFTAECLNAVSSEESFAVIEASGRGHLYDPSGVLGNVVEACAGLPDAISRAAQSSSQCAHLPEGDFESSPMKLLRLADALTLISMHLAQRDVDSALKLTVNAMGAFRDIIHGAPTTLFAMMALKAEERLADAFTLCLAQGSPRSTTREEVDFALGILDEIQLDVHRVLVADGLEIYEQARLLGGDREATDIGDYMNGRVLLEFGRACPADGSVEQCVEALDFPAPPQWKWYEILRTPRQEVSRMVEVLVSALALAKRSYVEQMTRQGGRLRALSALLNFDERRQRGQCEPPVLDGVEISGGENEQEFWVRASTSAGPGQRFFCPLDLTRVNRPPPDEPPRDSSRRRRRD